MIYRQITYCDMPILSRCIDIGQVLADTDKAVAYVRFCDRCVAFVFIQGILREVIRRPSLPPPLYNFSFGIHFLNENILCYVGCWSPDLDEWFLNHSCLCFGGYVWFSPQVRGSRRREAARGVRCLHRTVACRRVRGFGDEEEPWQGWAARPVSIPNIVTAQYQHWWQTSVYCPSIGLNSVL